MLCTVGQRIRILAMIVNDCLLILLIVNMVSPQKGGDCARFPRQKNLGRCLEYISRQMQNKSLYWFGTSYRYMCIGGYEESSEWDPECENPIPPGREPSDFESMGSRIFLDRSFTSADKFESLKYFFEITYSSPMGRSHWSSLVGVVYIFVFTNG